MQTVRLALLTLLLLGCEITAVNYAVGDVEILDRTKTEVEQKPAVRVSLTNSGQDTVFDIELTVKAKRNQKDVDVVAQRFSRMTAGDTVSTTLVFDHLAGHQQYDFLTYAVNFSRQEVQLEPNPEP